MATLFLLKRKAFFTALAPPQLCCGCSILVKNALLYHFFQSGSLLPLAQYFRKML